MVFILLIILIFLFPFGVITQIPLKTDLPIRIYLQDFILVILAAVFLLKIRAGRNKFIFSKQSKLFILFAIFALISLFLNLLNFSLTQIIVSSLYLFRLSAYFFVYLSAFQTIKKSKDKERIIIFLFIAGVLTSLLGIMQYFLYPNLRNLAYLGFDPHEKRIFGTFLDPNFFGIVSVLTIILANYYLHQLTMNRKKSLYLILAVLIFSLVFSYSRSSYLAFLAGITSFHFLNKNLKLTLFNILLFFFFLILILIPKDTGGEGVRLERTSTINARLMNYQESLAIFTKSPFFGVGFNTLRFAKEKYLSHNNLLNRNAASGSDSSLLLVLATTGIFGFLVFIKFLFFALLNKGEYRNLIFPSTISVLVHSLFVNSLFFPWILFWLFLIWGINDSFRNRF